MSEQKICEISNLLIGPSEVSPTLDIAASDIEIEGGARLVVVENVGLSRYERHAKSCVRSCLPWPSPFYMYCATFVFFFCFDKDPLRVEEPVSIFEIILMCRTPKVKKKKKKSYTSVEEGLGID